MCCCVAVAGVVVVAVAAAGVVFAVSYCSPVMTQWNPSFKNLVWDTADAEIKSFFSFSF